MLRKVYAPTDFISRNADPSVPVDTKLAIIADTPVTIEQMQRRGKLSKSEYRASLPFGPEASIIVTELPELNHIIFSDYVSLGDSELYSKGIGTRLLRGMLRFAAEHDPKITEFRTDWARLGLVNTAVSALGIENVGVEVDSTAAKRYGWGGNIPLDDAFDDVIHKRNRYFIFANIDHELALTWDKPVFTDMPKNQHSPH